MIDFTYLNDLINESEKIIVCRKLDPSLYNGKKKEKLETRFMYGFNGGICVKQSSKRYDVFPYLGFESILWGIKSPITKQIFFQHRPINGENNLYEILKNEETFGIIKIELPYKVPSEIVQPTDFTSWEKKLLQG